MRTDQLKKLIGREVALDPLPVSGQYPPDVLRWEMIKAGAGLALCVGIVVATQPTPWLGIPLLGIGALFGAYLAQQAGRVSLRIAVDDTGVTRMKGGRRDAYRWSELQDLRLNYYPHGRKAAKGVLVLVLRGAGRTIKIDSTLDQFPTLLARAAQAARDRRMELHPTTEGNFAQLGL